MYVTILDEKAKVYKDMDLNALVLIELVAGNVVELGETKKRGVEWVEVILPRGQHGYILKETKVKEVNMWTVADMKNDLRNWVFGLIAIGFISIALAGFLDPVWGFILIVIGVLALLIKHRGMFIVIGIALLLVGIMNISAGGTWTIFGFLQLYWGAQEISKFYKYNTSEALVLSTETFLTQKLEENDSTSSKSKISNGYLVCEKCNGYYKLQEGESPEDFEQCQCSGKLRYYEDISEFGNTEKRW